LLHEDKIGVSFHLNPFVELDVKLGEKVLA